MLPGHSQVGRRGHPGAAPSQRAAVGLRWMQIILRPRGHELHPHKLLHMWREPGVDSLKLLHSMAQGTPHQEPHELRQGEVSENDQLCPAG